MKALTSICVVIISALAAFNASGAVWDTSASGTERPTVMLSTNVLIFHFFPHCIVNQTTGTVVLTNDGPGVLDINSIKINTSLDFSETNACGSTLGAGQFCFITVTWDRVPARGSLVITDNGVGGRQSVTLTGFDTCPNR